MSNLALLNDVVRVTEFASFSDREPTILSCLFLITSWRTRKALLRQRSVSLILGTSVHKLKMYRERDKQSKEEQKEQEDERKKEQNRKKKNKRE